MKVAAYTSDRAAVAWYRMLTPLRQCQMQGLLEYRPSDMRVKPVLQAHNSRDEEVFAEYGAVAEWADILVTQRHTTFEGGGIFRAMSLVTGGVPWVLELDDNIVNLDTFNPAHNMYHERSFEECYEKREIESEDERRDGEAVFRNEETGQLIAVKTKQADYQRMNYGQIMDADALIVSTRQLGRYYRNIRRKRHKRDHIYVCPNSLDVDLWQAASPPEDHSPEIWIGWAGGGGHTVELGMLVPLVRHVLRKYPQVRFFWTRFPHPELMKLAQRWPDRCILVDSFAAIEDWIDFYTVLNFDIALAPLLNTSFNRGKSNLKWLEAGMLKQPCICSRVGPYAETVRDWVDGYLCAKPKEWIRAVDTLVESKALREQVGGAAHERVLAEYNLAENAHVWADAFQDIIEKLGPMAAERRGKVRYADTPAPAERDTSRLACAGVG